MKKIAFLFSAVLFTVTLQAQTVNFKTSFKPNTTYTQTTSMTNKVEVAYGAEPQVQEQNSAMTTVISVGALANNEMPINMVLNMDANQQGAAQLNGAKVIGKVSPDSAPVFTTMEAPNLPEQAKGMVMDMITEGVTNGFLPPRQVKVGETFVQEVPMNIPIGVGQTINMKDIITYKLEKVDGRKAYFSQNHVVTLDMTMDGENVKGTGSGTGQIVYDMDNTYPVQNDSTLELNMSFEAEGMPVNLKNITTSKVTTVIEPSK